MSDKTVTVAMPFGQTDVGVLAGEPPLVVNGDPGGGYNITHTPSGYCINGGGCYGSVREAARVRDAVIGLLDWSQDGAAITRQVKRDPVLRQKLVAAGLRMKRSTMKGA